MAEFETDKPFYIRKGFSSDGNMFPPDDKRPYTWGGIPLRFRTAEYLYQKTGGRAQRTEYSLAEIGGGTKELVPTVESVPAEKLAINSASKSQIETLDGIGPKISATIVELRLAQAFKSVEDLDERSPRPFGKSWSEFADKLSFE